MNTETKLDRITIVRTGDEVPIIGTSLRGYIACGYSQIHRKLGPPQEGDNWATQGNWSVEYSDGTIATIYDYQICESYLGATGKKLENNFDWHVGGSNAQALQNIQDTLGLQEDAVLHSHLRSDITQLQRYWDKIESIKK